MHRTTSSSSSAPTALVSHGILALYGDSMSGTEESDGGDVEPGAVVAAQIVKAAGPVLDHAAKEATSVGARLLGPLADVIGADWASRYSERNITRIARLAESRVSQNEDAIPPRVAAAVFEAGAFADDEFVAEYLSGVLASSRNANDRSDRGIGWTALVSRLSSEELRLHFIIYSVARRSLRGRDLSVAGVCATQLYLPFRELNSAMGWGESDVGDSTFTETFYGIHREGLVGATNFFFGPQMVLEDASQARIPGHGLLVMPSRAGIGLYLWGLGAGGRSLETIIDEEAGLELVEASDLSLRVAGGCAVSDLPPIATESATRSPLGDDALIRRAAERAGLPIDEWLRVVALRAATIQEE